ncbi:MAG: hypothetical protein AB9915_00575 [Candidatus Dojkabacteria bacterium]
MDINNTELENRARRMAATRIAIEEQERRIKEEGSMEEIEEEEDISNNPKLEELVDMYYNELRQQKEAAIEGSNAS